MKCGANEMVKLQMPTWTISSIYGNPGLSREDERQMKRMIGRINTIIEHADDKNVRVMVDAEQTYFQTAISRLAVEMQRVRTH